jgi:cytochrome P450
MKNEKYTMLNNIFKEQALNPFPFYRRMRDSQPVFYAPQLDSWTVFDYADIERVLTDYKLFSSVRNPQMSATRPNILNIDPPRHRQLRNLVTQAFTPRSVAQLTNRITTIVTQLLDQVASNDQVDIIDDLAYPLPVIVIAELLGIPPEDRARFKYWSDAAVGSLSTDTLDPRPEMGEYFLQIFAQRQDVPQDDLITALLNAQVEGEHLTQAEMLSFCVLLLVAGNETTTNLIGNMLLCLDDVPEAMDELRDEPSLIPSALEEVLRYRSPVQFTGRVATADTTVGGQAIKAGQRLQLLLGSANRDEAQFPHADTFDIRRTPNRHLAFGHGIHFCIGAPLARLEAKIALTVLLERFHAIQRVREVPLEHVGSPLMYGVKHLPVTLQPK